MQQTQTPVDFEAFNAALDDFMRAQRRARGRFNRTPAVPELSLSQYLLLEPLATAGEALPVGELAEAAGVAPPSATRMLDGLERRGLVERVRWTGDRRVVRVTVTEEGAALVRAKAARMHDARRDVFERLTPAERRSAARLLQSLAAAIEELHP
jgi:DNA-binding MarR family transcriptional regulator